MTRNERTTAHGLFNFALSYRAAADKLRRTKLKATHPDSPLTFLYYHAIELYLKAFLRGHGVSARELEDYRHNYRALRDRAVASGLLLDDEDEDVIAMLAATSTKLWSRSRYVITGPLRRPTFPALARTCRRLDRSVGRALVSIGVPLRRPTKSRQIGD